MSDNYTEILKENGQEHLLKYLEIANEEQKKRLIEDIKNIFRNVKYMVLDNNSTDNSYIIIY